MNDSKWERVSERLKARKKERAENCVFFSWNKTTIKRMNRFNASEYFITRSDAINQFYLFSWRVMRARARAREREIMHHHCVGFRFVVSAIVQTGKI